MTTTPVRGYKIFNPDFTCRDMKFAEDQTFEVPLPITGIDVNVKP